MVLGKLELGVLGTDAHATIDGLKLLLAVLGGDCATGLGQQFLAGECASRLGIVPRAIKLALAHLHATDDQAQEPVNRVLRAQAAQHSAQNIAQSAVARLAAGSRAHTHIAQQAR